MRGGPALGRFIEPAHGVWVVAARAELPARESHALAGLGAAVEVRYDDRGVPHIFAPGTADAYRALGWVHARDRLFQMEIQTRAVAGTLSELLGRRTLETDGEARAQGLAWGAERSYRATDSASAGGRAIRAYAEGVNAYIAGMTARDLPFEYHLLGGTPMRWEPEYSAYLLSRMGLTLAYSDGELRRAALEALVGRAAADALFPVNAPIQEPIEPNGRRAPRFDFVRIPAPAPADSARRALARAIERALERALDRDLDRDLARAASGVAGVARAGGEDAVGSNNWAVAPSRTAAKAGLLAGDPHLSLSMPSVWYEAHLVVPDTMDVYGVTLLGSPFVTIGFNRDVAWSLTNTGADVADYYEETVDDDAHPTRYRLDGAWRPLVARVETTRGRKGEALATDTIYHTHRGPMLRVGTRWVSRRWTVLDPQNSADVFGAANVARNSAELFRAFEAFEVAAQNVLTADRLGHIAVRSTGHFPVRPRGAPRGDVLLDGTSSANDWQGWWPPPAYPGALDPPQGFLASNNQQPRDPKAESRYLGWDWPAPWRAMRINALLRADSAVTPDAMRRYQTDAESEQTSVFVRAFVHAATTAPTSAWATAPASARASDDSALTRAAAILASWDGRFTVENERAALYGVALEELTRRTWDELTAEGAPREDRARRIATPNSMILAELLSDPANPWWDDRSTKDAREDRDAILRASLVAAYRRAIRQYGPPGPAWRWANIRKTNIHHLLRLPSLSRLGIPMQAGPGTLSPSGGDGTHGASWRMVVELGSDVRAWGTYPGGQSGNPVSRRYDDRLGTWAAGQLDTLRFPRRATDLAGRTLSSVLTLTPERRP